jgi:hypothetical protein
MKWIKCSDKPPPVDERIWMVCFSNHISEHMIKISKDTFGHARYIIQGYGEGCCAPEQLIYTAQYWMPIPKIPSQIKITGTSK